MLVLFLWHSSSLTSTISIEPLPKDMCQRNIIDICRINGRVIYLYKEYVEGGNRHTSAFYKLIIYDITNKLRLQIIKETAEQESCDSPYFRGRFTHQGNYFTTLNSNTFSVYKKTEEAEEAFALDDVLSDFMPRDLSQIMRDYVGGYYSEWKTLEVSQLILQQRAQSSLYLMPQTDLSVCHPRTKVVHLYGNNNDKHIIFLLHKELSTPIIQLQWDKTTDEFIGDNSIIPHTHTNNAQSIVLSNNYKYAAFTTTQSPHAWSLLNRCTNRIKRLNVPFDKVISAVGNDGQEFLIKSTLHNNDNNDRYKPATFDKINAGDSSPTQLIYSHTQQIINNRVFHDISINPMEFPKGTPNSITHSADPTANIRLGETHKLLLAHGHGVGHIARSRLDLEMICVSVNFPRPVTSSIKKMLTPTPSLGTNNKTRSTGLPVKRNNQNTLVKTLSYATWGAAACITILRIMWHQHATK